TGLYLTWSGDPTTTMDVNWVDIYPESTNDLFFREAGTEAEWEQVEATHTVVKPSSLQRRMVQLRDLEPDTLYHINIGGPAGSEKDGWTFRTMPADLSRPIRFITGGDMMHSRRKL